MLYRLIERIIMVGARKGERRYSFSFSHNERVSFDDLIRRMTSLGGVNSGDIIRIVYRLKDAIREELKKGNTVEVKGLGSFGLSVKYKDPSAEEMPRFSRRNIRDVKVMFRPAKEMKMDVSRLRFWEKRMEYKVKGDE